MHNHEVNFDFGSHFREISLRKPDQKAFIIECTCDRACMWICEGEIYCWQWQWIGNGQ